MKIKIIFPLIFALAILGCVQKPVLVNIPMRVEDAINFNKFDKIILSGFDIDSTIQTPDPKIELMDFFTHEFQKTLNRKIEYFEPEKNAADSIQSLREKLKNFPNSLLITGKFKTDVKTRSIVKDIKKETKKKKAFVKIELWEMELEVEYIDTNSFKTLGKKTIRSNLKDADPTKTEFNFKSLFDKITDQFLQESQKKVRIQVRYLLKNRKMP